MNTKQTDTESANNNHSSTPPAVALAKEGTSAPEAAPSPQGIPSSADILNPTLFPPSIALTKEGTVASSTPASAVMDTNPLPAPAQSRKLRRNGRIAGLPRVQRDMVNHMIWNGVPYKNIVAALDEEGYTVTERNVSNWATGGYLEWSLVQEHSLQNRLNQDHMLDFLRRDDAQELPEVGLQAAATRLSQVLLQKLARGEDPEANLDKYSKLVDLLVRLNREMAASQKQRDDSRRTLGREYDPALVKEVEQISAIENERLHSDPPSDSGLPRPSVPPALPPIPTATFLARQARERWECAEAERKKRNFDMLKAALSKNASAAKQIENTPAPAANPPENSTPPSPEAAR